MSLDVSPDGHTIVFDLLGDLYTLPITGGTARRLTSGTAINRQPRYSPNGRQLVFVSDRNGRENVWIADRDGRNAYQLSDLRGYDAIGAVTSPIWSPDGRTVFVSQRLGATRTGLNWGDPRRFMWLIATYDVATRQMRWVSDTVRARARSVLSPAFDVQRHALYAAVHFDPLPVDDRLGHWLIGRLDLTTGGLSPEVGRNIGRASLRPGVSPNGRWLVYASASGSHLGLRVRDLTTDQEHWLVREVLDDPSGQEHYEPRDPVPGYAFTPDSKALIAAYGGKIRRVDLAMGHATVIPFVAEVERLLGPFKRHQFSLPDTAVRARGVLQPALSPDGQRVAFSALDRLWIMELPVNGRPARRPFRLTSDSVGEFYPAWSPDGTWIAYTTWRDGVGGTVWRATVPLGRSGRRAPQRLTTDTALYFHTAVARDGKRVVAVRLDAPTDRMLLFPGMSYPARPVEPQLVWLPSQGGPFRKIASLPSTIGFTLRDLVKQLYFTADSARIYAGLSFWGWDGSHRPMALAVKDRDGAVFREPEPEFLDGVLSPDGRRALLSAGSTLYEVHFPTGSSRHKDKVDTLDLEVSLDHSFDQNGVVARQWGAALKPWISWSHHGRRAVFAQGSVLYIGDVSPAGWVTFQRVEVPLPITPDMPRGTIVFRGARLITMRGREIIEHGDLVVRDNRIVAIGLSGQVPIPPRSRIIDASGTTILPGYVDIHEHGLRPYGVHAEQLWMSLLELAYGVTAVRDPQSQSDNDDFAYADRERAGEFLSPRLFSTGVPYLAPHPPIRTLDAAREAVRRHAEDFRTETFKIYGDVDTDRRTRQLLAMAARQAGLNATTHNNGGDQALAGLIDGLTGIEHRPNIKIYDDVALLIARSEVTYTHTYLGSLRGSVAYVTRRYGRPLDYPIVRRFVPPSAREITCRPCTSHLAPAHGPLESANLLPMVSGPARIVAHGGHVGIGAHGNLPGIGFHYEMWLHVVGGMPNHEVLRSATIVGATAIGHARDFGSLEPGKLADLQMLAKNPLEDIHHTTSLRYVMKNGRLYQADDLTEIWPRHKPLSPIYLWDATSAGDLSERPGGSTIKPRRRVTLRLRAGL